MKTTLLTLFAVSALLAGCVETPEAPAADEVIMLETPPAPSVEEVMSF